MHKKFDEKKLLIASGNAGKIKEIKELLAPFSVEVISAKEFDLVEPEENGLTFIENAEIKAKYYGDKTGFPALADDSGLCVNALNGAPGIYSARWAGEDKDFSIAMKKIAEKLKDKRDKTAYFACALSLYWPDSGDSESVEGRVNGSLVFPPRGEKGFGYDPIFIANGNTKTFAEMIPEEKAAISHRSDAFKKLINACFV